MKKYLGLTALAGALAMGGGWMLPGSTLGAAQAQEAPAEVELIEIQDMMLGDPDAPVTVIEYGSFTCVHCANFHANQFASLNAEYIESGQVNFIFREVYFDRFALWASMIARCDDTRFFGIHDLLFEGQQQWIAGGQDPALIADNLRTIGITAGLDAAAVDACMQDEVMAQSLVTWFDGNATEDGITATPTLFIDGQKYSNMAWSDMQRLIDAALAG